MPLLMVYGMCAGSAVVVGLITYPILEATLVDYINRRTDEAAARLNDIFMSLSRSTVWMLYVVTPFAMGLLAWICVGHWIAGCVGMILGLFTPSIAVAQMHRHHRKRFDGQLIDGLLLLSSSLKAGLSMTQAFTVLVEEMPPPISQEFSLMLKESRMGVNLDETLAHLKHRIPGDDVALFVTAVLVARETGGDITRIFGRLVETIRDRKKLRERIMTLTFMARMQGILMGMLPFLFGVLVYQMNPSYFRFFFIDPTGRLLLTIIIALQIVGGAMFVRFSRSPI